MKLTTALERIREKRFGDDSQAEKEVDEVVAFAVRRLVTEPFEVFAKGLNPSRFESWSKGARSKVARRFGSSSDLVLEVLRGAISPVRGDLAAAMSLGAEVIDAGAPYDEMAREFAQTYLHRLLNEDFIRLQFYAWIAAPDRLVLATELNQMYASIEASVETGIRDILRAANRRPRPGFDFAEQAGNLITMLEGSVLQGAVRDEEMIAKRFGDYVVFVIENASEPID